MLDKIMAEMKHCFHFSNVSQKQSIRSIQQPSHSPEEPPPSSPPLKKKSISWNTPDKPSWQIVELFSPYVN